MKRHSPRPRCASRFRLVTPTVDLLESRELLSASPGFGPYAQGASMAQTGGAILAPMYAVVPQVNPTPPAGAFTPAQIQQAYGFNKINFGAIHGDGTGQTIAIVDAYHNPNMQADLNTFNAQFGLPNITITQVNQVGGTSYPSTDPTGGWELEEALDVEWAHAIAPGAKILLVEANSPNDTDLLTAVDYAAAHSNVVSLSWGGSEFAGENSPSYENHFIHPGVAFVASSGDSGAPISWPASSPNVLAVGGTGLTIGAGSAWVSETGWTGSGGGPSAYESQPTYQAGVVTQTTKRANPDVSYDANPNTGFAIYDTFNYNGSSLGWLQIGGTSAGAPQWAALIAIADQGRALSGLPALDASSPQEVMAILYKSANSVDFHDVTTGSSTGTPNYAAGVGYDYVTGLGSPKADLVVQSLVGAPAAPIDSLILSAPTADIAGTSFNITVSAKLPNGTIDGSYLGTVRFTGTDAQSSPPANYTFVAADRGVHTFTVTLKTAGTQSITATDTTKPAITGSASGIVVSPAAASQLILTGLPATATAGSSQSFTVTAKDAYGNVATGYVGGVHFSSTDTVATLPRNYVFLATDKGTHNFNVAFSTAGSQTITVADAVSNLSVTQSGISVSPAAPINLTASAASSSQINLAWTGAAGATGYLIERSTNGSTGWAQIATTATSTLTYQNTGLIAATTYYYRVRASGGNNTSAYSNPASATTSGTLNSTVNTLWSNTYTPSIDSYAAGSYELGLKFRSDVAGSVTGVRFYKQTWMNGYTHVGHLWSSTGTLLATATFTGETASGWEQVKFSNPVAVAANTVYLVSFSTGGGYAGISSGFFSAGGLDNGPLHALANSTSGGNGVYQSSGRFPNVNGSGMNFWVDVAFTPSSAPQAILGGTQTPQAGSVGHFVAIATSSNSTATPGSPSTPTSAAPHSEGANKTVSIPSTRSVPHQDAGSNESSWPYRRTINQALALSSSQPKVGTSWVPFGS
ncbi:MAG: hypothetical protein JWN86_4046 [Planctomycetota bacterium]|nr:hypothetical protein [Planctomycetota bacterium]